MSDIICSQFEILQLFVIVIVHCKNELVILTLIWLHEFQCSIDNMLLRYSKFLFSYTKLFGYNN